MSFGGKFRHGLKLITVLDRVVSH